MGVTIRKDEIAIMKYIGAKDGFVRAPFVIEGIVIGFIGAALPLVALYFMYDKAVAYILLLASTNRSTLFLFAIVSRSWVALS